MTNETSEGKSLKLTKLLGIFKVPSRYEMLFGGIQLNYKLITKNGSSVDEAILQTIQVVTTPFIFENIVFFFFRVTDSAEL